MSGAGWRSRCRTNLQQRDGGSQQGSAAVSPSLWSNGQRRRGEAGGRVDASRPLDVSPVSRSDQDAAAARGPERHTRSDPPGAHSSLPPPPPSPRHVRLVRQAGGPVAASGSRLLQPEQEHDSQSIRRQEHAVRPTTADTTKNQRPGGDHARGGRALGGADRGSTAAGRRLARAGSSECAIFSRQ